VLEGKLAIVVGGGQTPGETIGNGRATAIQFAREGATVLVADIDEASAEETVTMITDEGGNASAHHVDVTDEKSLEALVENAVTNYQRVDILHNNVGMSLAAGDAFVTEITTDAFDRIVAINLRSMIIACKYVLPHMRAAQSGVILNISSMAALRPYPYVTYKVTKAAVVAFTEQLAQMNARYNIRANVILPGLMNTPMAIESRVTDATPRAEVIARRDKQVPLGQKMGTAWDIAHAAAFLASDKAGFITGVSLPVDGGSSVS